MHPLLLLAADAAGPLARLFDGSGLLGHPLLLAALILGGILAVTKLAKIDLTFLIPFLEIPLRWLLAKPDDGTLALIRSLQSGSFGQAIATAIAATVVETMKPLIERMEKLIEVNKPPAPPAPTP